MPDLTDPAGPHPWWRWLVLTLAVAGATVVGWVCVTEWGGVLHGHPAYPILLGLTLVVSAATAWRTRRELPLPHGWRRAVHVAVLIAGVGWVAGIAWLRPFTAVEPALAAMSSDAVVDVSESPTQIVMRPRDPVSETGVFFQPGALVDPRAYAAVLRPLAEHGHVVVIVKPPLGIAFLSVSAFDGARAAHADTSQWVLGGHSLGGVVAAMEADAADRDTSYPAVGLLLYASYPSGDVSRSLTAAVESISGTEDGLSTPAKIAASREDLPFDATFTIIHGASHASFGDYGPQPGDGTATISQEDARTQISRASLRFADALGT